MPILCVLAKRPTGAPLTAASVCAVDELQLNQLLCPYRGEIHRVPIAMHGGAVGVLRLSSLAGMHRSKCLIPADTNKNASTAWLEITIDSSGLTFETDPFGTFPLWWFEDDSRIVITSEVKSLNALQGVRIELNDIALRKQCHPLDFSPFRRIRRVYPGAILRASPKLELSEERPTPLVFRPYSTFPSYAAAEDALDAALIASARAIFGESARSASWGTFLSGGIDSSLATALTRAHHPDAKTLTLGTALGDEYSEAETIASHLGLAHTRVTADEEAALVHFEHAVFCNEVTDGLTAEILAQLGILAAAAADRNVRRIVTGYGADLLFGAMLRHQQYMEATGVRDAQSLIERTCWTREFAPFYAWSLGIDIHHLFWDPALMNTALRIASGSSFDGTDEKALLRNLAAKRGYLDHRHVGRRKQAMTDGTQFNRLLSSALGLEDGYAYEQKSARCVSQLRGLFDRTRTEGVAS